MNNLPQRYNLIYHIKNFFYNLFNRKRKIPVSNIENSPPSEEKNLFTDRLKDDIRKRMVKQKLIEEIEDNPNVLNSLSLERLEQIENMYDEIIKENKCILKELDFKTAAMALSNKAISIDDPQLMAENKLAIILGTEGDGLAAHTIADCDYTVCIPMSHGVDSLNVAAASAIAFWQLGNR